MSTTIPYKAVKHKKNNDIFISIDRLTFLLKDSGILYNSDIVYEDDYYLMYEGNITEDEYNKLREGK